MNLPNKISLARILLIPVMVAAFYLNEISGGFSFGGLIAAVIFVFAASTDFLDGHIARKRNLVTDMGKFLDPIADKLLVICALFLAVDARLIIAPYGAIFASLIVARELIISGFRQIAASKSVIIAADKAGKIKAVLQYIALAMFLAIKTFNKIIGAGLLKDLLFAYSILAHAVFFVAVVLTVYSGISYIVKNKAVLK